MKRPVSVVLTAVAFLALVLVAQWVRGPSAAIPGSTPGARLPSQAAQSQPADHRAGLPDARLTPGAVNPAVTPLTLAMTICTSGWTRTVRPPAAYTGALKVAQIVEYGYPDRDPSHYEEDHLVPLELGGAPRDPRNLWPEPDAATLPDGTPVGSATKDRLENWLKDAVCAGSRDLGDAQRAIAGDWVQAWIEAGRP